MPSRLLTSFTTTEVAKKYEYKTIRELHRLIQPSGAKWCLYGVVKFCREINDNCMLLGLCDPTSYGKGPKGVSCLLYRESFAGTTKLPVQIEVGQLIRLHRMKITSYRPENGCIQLKSSNYYSWLIFDGKDDIDFEPVAQSSVSYSFGNNDRRIIAELRTWLLSFGDDETLNEELDLQFVLPEPRVFIDQSTQTNENERNATESENDEPAEFFSALEEEIVPLKNRLRPRHK